ncbi:MAG: hypothetical protein AABX00_01475 [Nanoarchaeota archaeon]
MEIQELVEAWKQKYESDVKPWIQQGNHFIACAEMGNLVELIRMEKELLTPGTSLLMSLLGTATILRDELARPYPQLGLRTRMFEYLLEQTSPPLQPITTQP